MDQNQLEVAFIGAGNMARALIQGLVAAGTDAGNLRAADIAEDALDRLSVETGVSTFTDNNQAIAGAHVVVLAVKPQVMAAVLESLDPRPGQLVISIAAGIPISTLAKGLPLNQPVVRCMPNTPALVSEGMSALYASSDVTESMRSSAARILSAVGDTVWVDSEDALDAVTAVSGSGPAYFFYLMEHMIRAGEQLGLSNALATQLTLQTAVGAAKLAAQSSDAPAQLRANVTSPGGTTQAALAIFDEAATADVIVRALQGASDRSAELAQELA